MQQDTGLFWIQKPHLDIVFEGARVRTNALGLRDRPFGKKNGQVRIVCLGASPTFGWGVDQNEVYAKQLEESLRKTFTRTNIEVINAGQIGYSSFQGLRFFKEKILPLAPDIITVAYVINDVDKYRFYRNHGKSDKELGLKNDVLVAIENFLDRSKFFTAYKKFILQSQALSLQYFGQRGSGEYVNQRRVSALDYRNNLKSLIKTAKENGITVVLLKMPVNLPSAEDVSPEIQKQADEKINQVVRRTNLQDYEGALAGLKTALELNPNSARAYYYLGQLSLKLNKKTDAENYFKKTVLMELYECKALAKQYNIIMQEIAGEEQLVLVDIVDEFSAYFQKSNEYLFLDPEHDTIHPNKLGHAIISQSIYKVLIENKFFNKIS
ncbi:MAG: GDSL-type esterase/lipase family protein [Candidatus Omnitrophota bacterium]